jgi:uncharacterized protein (UPF0335 family)
MAKIIEGRNGASDEALKDYIAKYEAMEAEKLSSKMSHASVCAKISARQKDLLDEAKSAGVNKKSFKAVIKVRDLERKVDAAREELEDDEMETFDDIMEVLGDFGDLPLGQAAASKGKKAKAGDDDDGQDATTSAIVDAVKADMADSEWEKAAPVH